MKKIVLLILLLPCIVTSQEKLELTYKVTSAGTTYDPTDASMESIKDYIFKMEEELNDLTYSLRLRGTESLWFLHDKMSYSDAHMGKAYGGDHTYFFDATANEYIEQRLFLDHFFILKSKQREFKWELFDETKEILGYTCYKAVSKEEKLIKGQTKSFYTVAWYAPKLKYTVGPLDFGGLNGLILELTDKKRKYYCTEILSPKQISLFILEKPTQGKAISEADYLIEMNKIAEAKGFPTTKD
jgi:GLPGLI family protein